MKLSERILNIQESKTVQFTPMLQKMHREGKWFPEKPLEWTGTFVSPMLQPKTY